MRPLAEAVRRMQFQFWHSSGPPVCFRGVLFYNRRACSAPRISAQSLPRSSPWSVSPQPAASLRLVRCISSKNNRSTSASCPVRLPTRRRRFRLTLRIGCGIPAIGPSPLSKHGFPAGGAFKPACCKRIGMGRTRTSRLLPTTIETPRSRSRRRGQSARVTPSRSPTKSRPLQKRDQP